MAAGKILAGAGAIALALAFGWLHGNARYAEGREAMRAELATAARDQATSALDSYAKGVAAGQAGTIRFTGWLEKVFQPTAEKVTRDAAIYQASMAGAVICFDAAGVSGANADIAAANFTFTPAAGGSSAALSATEDDRDPAGRHGDARTGAALDLLDGTGLRPM